MNQIKPKKIKFMKHSVFVLQLILYLLLIIDCAGPKQETSMAQKSKEEYQKEQKYRKANKYISEKRKDSTIYFGDGTANIGDDLGQAKIEAKKRAREALAKQIKVAVESDFKMIVSSESENIGKKYSEKTTEEIRKRTQQYTDQVLTNVMESPPFIDYPQDSLITYILYIDKDKYKKQVKNDLNRKKEMIKSMVIKGNKEFKKQHYYSALKNWIDAKIYLDKFFKGLPVQDDINHDGVDEEINSNVNGKINKLLGNLSLSLLNKDFIYDIKGRLNHNPILYLQYNDSLNKKQPVQNFRIKSVFVENDGNISRTINTGKYGQAELKINKVQPENSTAILKSQIDKKMIPQLHKYYSAELPSIRINLQRKKTIAMAISFYNGDEKHAPEMLKNKMNSVALDRDFGVITTAVQGSDVSADEISEANKLNADYLLYVNISASKASSVGGYDNMFTSDCSGKVSLYNLPSGNMVKTKQSKSVEGYGSSSSNAGWDGYGKLEKPIIEITKTILGAVE